ncbi:methylthioadenosine/purine nucleoside phosphorylase, putative [Perkinsus marinus ATCC 50983]|uniref:Methylthioadenosine/purine nucleoside phosphorylase, putative n=1 Tax=Perkinsus marinus (strain ATCC 50983 / TXsc) TaxID=423536 RepID=C5KDS7_PERM5|nr:methylthioadenosine/purine nucleoside phosphorylase, putative [Perkinsus marinus ATCC 50983]EER17380.1 methylthioadenosine/purine nucleoside phosphorylase, putative [Perkinsus marinus ATCC 50983]|eukprot:XP_002785584.1 methylthioadenosine/purine nucleoside phosphorylase, putative [Perkinsus marinus ATCC 50983]
MWAIAHELLCDKIIALASVGSIRPDLFKIGDIAVPTDFIDFAPQRGTMTFWGNPDVGPFSGEKGRIHYTPCDHDDHVWRKKIAGTLFPFQEGPHIVSLSEANETETDVVYTQTNGPRFESRAEVRMLQRYGHLVGMTCASEWTLAGELGVPYAIVAMVDNLGNGLDSGINGNFMSEYQKHRREHFHTTGAILDQICRKARELLL